VITAAGEPAAPGFASSLPTDSPPGRLARLRAALAHPPLWITFSVCALILAARRPTELRNPQFWAEDGVYYKKAYTLGARALLEPFGGYLHTVQRIVAAVSQWFDPAWAPAIFTGAAFLLTLYVAARTQSPRFPLRPHVGYALAVVLVPDTFEVLLFLTNILRVTAAGLLLVLISKDGRRWWEQAHDAAAALLFGLTGPYSVLFAPLFVWRAWRRRTRASLVLAVLVIGCALTQGILIGLQQMGKLAADEGPVAMGAGDVVPEKLLAVPGMRIAGSLLAGSRVPPDYPLPVEIALGIGVLVAVALLALRKGPTRTERVWLAMAFLLVLASALYRCRFVLPDLCHAVYGNRYFYLPQLIVLWLLIDLALERRRWLSRGAAVLLLWMLVANIPRLREPGLPDMRWADYAARIRAGEAVEIPTNPGGVDPWIVRLPARKP
jgi:hypothetical protein